MRWNESHKKLASLSETASVYCLRCMLLILRPLTLMIWMTGRVVTIMTRCHVMNISAPSRSPHSDTARAPDHGMEFLWLTFPRVSPHLPSPLSSVLASRSNPLSLMREGEIQFYARLKMLSNDSKAFKGSSQFSKHTNLYKVQKFWQGLLDHKKIDFAISELCNL